jgi:uncharacterized membrane protein
MSADLYPWILIGHLFGDILWVAGMLAVLGLLWVHGGADASSRPGIVATARMMAVIMELGATLAIGLGLWLALASPRFATNAFASGGWLHVKLTLVVLGLLAGHGILRGKLGKLARGQQATVPGWLLPAILLAALGAVILGKHPTLLRKTPPAAPPAAVIDAPRPG